MNFNHSKKSQNQSLSKKKTSGTTKTLLGLPHALPALWKKQTDWEASRLQQRSGITRHKQAER